MYVRLQKVNPVSGMWEEMPTCRDEEIAELVEALEMMRRYAQWQMDEGQIWHPTLPSAVAKTEALIAKHKVGK